LKTVLVAGATGAVARNAVRSLLATGEANVIAVSRSAERLEELRRSLDARLQPSFTGIEGDAGDFAGASALAARVKGDGIDAAVAIFGRGEWTSGPLLELSDGEWQTVLDEMLTAHFAFARAVVPLLAGRADSLYLSLGGGAAFAPVRDAGLMSIAAAGQLMLTRTLERERGAEPPRVLELIVNGPVVAQEHEAAARPSAITAAAVGRVVTELVLRGVTTWEAAEVDGPFVVMNERSRERL
jgi:NAD(P)-dependent dehydrogenase (short-subunit alcohol dehydrogenase family)